MRVIVAGNDRAAALARTVLYETLIYAASRLGEIADDVVDIDRALRWGFGWELGPFETWDALGVKATAAAMEAAGYTVPGWVKEQLAAQGDGMKFYRHDAPGKHRAARQARRLHAGADRPAPAVAGRGARRGRRGASATAARRCWTSATACSCLEFHTKMNAIDADIIAMTMKAVERAERDFVALVIGNDGPDAFCVGANLFGLVDAS